MIKQLFKNNVKKPEMQKPKVTLWGVSISPYVRKVMVALAEKNIAFEQKEILPKALLLAIGQSIPAEFDSISPLGKIPVLQVDDFAISDSAAIAGYLDRKFSTGNKLHADNSEQYAQTIWFQNFSDTVLTDVAYKKIFLESIVKPKVLNIEPNHTMVAEAKQNELPPLLNFLDQLVAKTKWIGGDHFSIADIAISTQLLALRMADFEICAKKWPHLSSYFQKIISRPSFNQIIAT